jgi:hypothetical protein
MKEQNKIKYEELQEMIIIHEEQITLLKNQLIFQIRKVVDELQHINIIKNSLNDTIFNNESSRKIGGSILGLGIGFVTKKLLFGNHKGLIKNVSGNIIEFALAQLISHNASPILQAGKSLLNIFMDKRKKATS